MTFDTRSFRDTLGLFVTGVTIVTTRTLKGEPVGVTANSFNSVSMEPPLILWSLSKNSGSLEAFELAGHFAVHILRRDQIDLSNRFAKSGGGKFEAVTTRPGIGGVPVFDDCAARLECRTYNRHSAGDHTVFIGEVVQIASEPSAAPLLYHGGRYASLSPDIL